MATDAQQDADSGDVDPNAADNPDPNEGATKGACDDSCYAELAQKGAECRKT